MGSNNRGYSREYEIINKKVKYSGNRRQEY